MVSECVVCKKEFTKNRKRQFLCGIECRSKYLSKEKNHSYRGVKDKENLCLACGAVFFKKKTSEIKSSKCCSRKCNSAYWKANGHPLSHNLVGNCFFCKKEIKITRRKIGKRTFCSRECSDKGHSIHISGINNGRYLNGLANKRRYPYIFIKMREEVKRRDGFQCVLCKMKSEEYDKEFDVHHIDYNEENNMIDNLITLCRFCHGQMHGARKERLGWKEKLSNLLK